MILDLTPDELLSTTRCVRRRLDLTRPVEREVLEDCLRLAQPAPPASYRGAWHLVLGPATWSFMLAARSRGLGSCLTSFHLMYEQEAAEILGLPYDEIMQTALVPVAYTIGTDFKPARRKPLETMVHWDRW